MGTILRYLSALFTHVVGEGDAAYLPRVCSPQEKGHKVNVAGGPSRMSRGARGWAACFERDGGPRPVRMSSTVIMGNLIRRVERPWCSMVSGWVAASCAAYVPSPSPSSPSPSSAMIVAVVVVYRFIRRRCGSPTRRDGCPARADLYYASISVGWASGTRRTYQMFSNAQARCQNACEGVKFVCDAVPHVEIPALRSVLGVFKWVGPRV